MKTYIINLERSNVRRANIIGEMEAQGLDFELIQAVDGSALSDEELREVRMTDAVRNNPEYYTRSVIGAALSHVSIYQQIVNDGVEVALVLEDDVILARNFSAILAAVESQISDNEIILLNYMSFQPLILSTAVAQKLGDGVALYYPVDFSRVNSGAGYVITQAAARSLLKVVIPIHAEADSWNGFYNQGGFDSIRFAHPMPISVRGEKSTIAVDHQTALRATITSIVSDYRIPPFYQILKYLRIRSIRARSEVRFVETPASRK